MANRLTVVAGGLANAYLASAKGLPAEVGPASRLPTPAQLRDALDSLGLTYECGEWHDGWWFDPTDPNGDDGPERDFQELSLSDDSYGFRLGPSLGPFEIIRAVARTCGPQVAVEHSGARGVIVTEDTTYQEFDDALFH